MVVLVMDPQPAFKHFCRICKKGFGCGRALGGHMRAHGIGDEVSHIDYDDPASDWEDKLGGPMGKPMYALRTNPNRLKSCRACKNCGKEFSSWKSFLEHGKCSSPVSSPGSEDDEGAVQRGCGGWSKGKRSRRVLKLGPALNSPSSEEEDLANCLVMLSTARVDPPLAESEESCASASKEDERQQNWPDIMEVGRAVGEKSKGGPGGMFECKACKKVFNSHQALGGHRASHKKVKGCFAAKLDGREESLVEEDVITQDEFIAASKVTALPFDHDDHHHPSILPVRKKSKVHECSICHRVFASGQALGGHKRCHWVTSNSPDAPVAKLRQFEEHSPQLIQQRQVQYQSEAPLDLNLPAPIDDLLVIRQEKEPALEVDVPTGLYLKQWIGVHSSCNNNYNILMKMKNMVNHVEDEAESKTKLAKLSELKDMNMGGDSSPWLQVGIGSTANGNNDP